jgi:hypothetical protein
MSAHAWINELPPLIIAVALILLGIGVWKDREPVRRLAYICFVVSGVFTIVMVATGEHALENVPPEGLSFFRTHAFMGATALGLNMLCFVLAVCLEVLDHVKRFARVATPLLIACGMVTLVTMLLALGMGKALTGQ